jgi:hypothetical protein
MKLKNPAIQLAYTGCDYPQGAKINTLVDQITQNFVGLPRVLIFGAYLVYACMAYILI